MASLEKPGIGLWLWLRGLQAEAVNVTEAMTITEAVTMVVEAVAVAEIVAVTEAGLRTGAFFPHIYSYTNLKTSPIAHNRKAHKLPLILY